MRTRRVSRSRGGRSVVAANASNRSGAGTDAGAFGRAYQYIEEIHLICIVMDQNFFFTPM